MGAISALIGAALAIPGLRSFLLAFAVQVLFHSSADPAFRLAFDALQAELASAPDEATKRAVLVKIRALRPGNAPAS